MGFFVSEFLDSTDLKNYFENNFSYLYYIFYESFCGLENDFKLKGKI